MGSDFATGDSRSFASSKHDPRRMCSLESDDDSGHFMDAMCEMIQKDLLNLGIVKFALGQDRLFQLSRETYMLTFNDGSWLDDGPIADALSDVLLVSAYKALVKLRGLSPSSFSLRH